MTAVHPTAIRRLPRMLAAATAAIGFTGTGLALAMASGGAPAASAAHARLDASTAHLQDNPWPYFACASVGDWGVCVGPPTN